MKVALIALPHPYLRQPEAQAPLGVLYLAAVLEKAGIEVSVHNFAALTDAQALAALPDAALYGITVTSMELPQANRFAARIKLQRPAARVVLGGPGTISAEFVDWDHVDAVCHGEGEGTVLDMAADLCNGGLKRIYEGRPVEDLDVLPFPARHLLQGSQGGNVFAYNRNYRGTGSVTILTSRGCPFSCAFCSAPALNGQVRYRDPGAVVEEMKHVIADYGIRQFRISDDMFTANAQHVLELCRLVGGLDVAWRISIRAKPLTLELLRALHAAGCKEVSIGIESFDDDVLKLLNKGTTSSDNIRALRLCAEAGMRARALMMIRTPGQTRRTVARNISGLAGAPYEIVACTVFVPLPGSDIWNDPDKYGIEILSRNLDDYNFYFFNREGENALKDIVRIKGRTIEELNQETTWFKTYLKATGKLNMG